MVERFTITAAEQDPWVDVDANGQWVRYADYAAEREQWINYTTDLQRIIEALCGNRKLPQPVSSARHHYNMAERALAERAGGVNEDALRALAQAYDREDAAQRGEPDPWNLDDPGDIGDSDTWVSERLACARAAAEAFLSALEPSAARSQAVGIDAIKGALADLIGHAKWVDVNFDISYAHLHEAEAVFAALSSPDHAHAGKVEGDGLPQDVINLVIAAREVWEEADTLSYYHSDEEFSQRVKALDKALEPFGERVPFENEPYAPASEDAE